MKYTAPFWLPNGHLQTIYPATCIAKPAVAFRRERWATPDGDFIDVDFVDGQPGQPFVTLFHGLDGRVPVPPRASRSRLAPVPPGRLLAMPDVTGESAAARCFT